MRYHVVLQNDNNIIMAMKKAIAAMLESKRTEKGGAYLILSDSGVRKMPRASKIVVRSTKVLVTDRRDVPDVHPVKTAIHSRGKLLD